MSHIKATDSPIIRHILSAGAVLITLAVAWGAMGADVNTIKDKTEATNIRVDRVEKRVRGNSQKISRIDERTKLILDMVKEINRKIPVRVR